MKKPVLRTIRLLLIGWAFLTVMSCGPAGSALLPTVTPGPRGAVEPVSQPGDLQVRQNLLRSTVQIFALVEGGGQLQPIWTGSGTILSPGGLILTNAHIVSDPDPAYQPDALGVAVTVRSDQLPDLRYLAEVRAIDYRLDLAVVQVVSDLDGRPIDPAQLNLNYVPLGDSDLLELGDLLQILGYPGIGGETITFTEGVVSGFTRERGVEGRAYVKTDATIAGGNSGGLAANQDGQIIGVPTQVGYGGTDRFADCRYLADTNGDGVVDQNDNCIPVGGFINALRPINLARPLIEAARTGIAPMPTPAPPTVPAGAPRFYDVVFAPDVTADDQPAQIVSRLSSGATSVYAFWDYAGMADGMTWEARWYRDGEYLDGASLPPSPWQGGERGYWWNGVANPSGLSDGTYRVELHVAGELLLQGSIPVGGAAAGPALTNLIFSDAVTVDDRPTNPTYLLPSGITTVYAFFDYAGMRDGMGWSRVWSYEGEQVSAGSDTWGWGPSGSAWISISAGGPLDPGTYRLELFVEGAPVAAANFAVAGTQAQGPFGPITFAAGVDGQGNPVDPGTAFPSGLTELHFLCTYAGMQNGLDFVEKWFLDGGELVTFDAAWDEGASGTFHDSIYRDSGGPLPDGEYALELYVEGQLVQQGTAVVGTGAPPPTPPPAADGLFIQGYVRDADTGRGIPGATYVVIEPGVTADGWDGSAAQIYASAATGGDGYFELLRPLRRNERYSIIVWAAGYLPATGDNLLVSDEPSPLQVEVRLQRD